MKLRFEGDLDFHWQAVESVCDVFRRPGGMSDRVHGHAESYITSLNGVP